MPTALAPQNALLLKPNHRLPQQAQSGQQEAPGQQPALAAVLVTQQASSGQQEAPVEQHSSSEQGEPG